MSPVFVPVTVYVIVSPACTAVPDAGSADWLMVKPDPMTGCWVVTAGGTMGVPGICGPSGSAGFVVVGVAEPAAMSLRTSPEVSLSTVTE